MGPELCSLTVRVQATESTKRKRKLTEKARGDDSEVTKKAKPLSSAASSSSKPASSRSVHAPASVAGSSASSSSKAVVRYGHQKLDFAGFLNQAKLERMVSVFADEGFVLEKDVRLLKQLSPETRNWMFNWLATEKKASLRDLVILHDKIVKSRT